VISNPPCLYVPKTSSRHFYILKQLVGWCIALYDMSCQIVDRNLRELTVNVSIEMVTSWWVSNYLSVISTRLLPAGARFVIVVLPLIVATSGPYTFAAKLMSSVVTLLFLIRFIRIIAFRSSKDGVPSVWYNTLAFWLFLVVLVSKNPIFVQMFTLDVV